MHHPALHPWRHAAAALALSLLALSPVARAATPADEAHARQTTPSPIANLQRDMQVGDLVFIRVTALPFRKVAAATGSWTNHVGIVIDTSGAEPLIGESKFPVSTSTPLSRFVSRSEEGRVAVMRLNTPLTDAQRATVKRAADARMGVVYDTGFDLHSQRQFCSRYAREVLAEATGLLVGEVETFSHLLERNPAAGLTFWRVWYAGQIPWTRETVTPASLLQSPLTHAAFDGRVAVTANKTSPREP